MEVEIVVVVPHQRDLNVRGLGSFTLKTCSEFGHGSLGRLPRLEFFLLTGRLNFSETLLLCFSHLSLTGRFLFGGKAGFFLVAFGRSTRCFFFLAATRFFKFRLAASLV